MDMLKIFGNLISGGNKEFEIRQKFEACDMEGIILSEPVIHSDTHLPAKFNSREAAGQFIEANHPGGELTIVPVRK
jgi:hypothetical protein